MDVIVNFFRNTLSGLTYLVNLIVALIIFFSCIGYMVSEKIYQTSDGAVKKEDNSKKAEPLQQTVANTATPPKQEAATAVVHVQK